MRKCSMSSRCSLIIYAVIKFEEAMFAFYSRSPLTAARLLSHHGARMSTDSLHFATALGVRRGRLDARGRARPQLTC